MTSRSLEGNCRLQKTKAVLKGKKSKLMVTCDNTVLSAENDNRSPESKKGHWGQRQLWYFCTMLSQDCLLLEEGGIEAQSAVHLEAKLEPHKQFSPM